MSDGLMSWNPFNTKIGLALGGGAAKGIAHVGALKAFQENEINIAYLAGTSAGALVAAYYAFGIPIEKINEIGKTLNIRRLMSFSFKSLGLIDSQAVHDMLIADIGDVDIKDAIIPLAITATDINTGQQVVFTEGRLADIVCASMAMPGLFVPVPLNDLLLVDGGIVENVPVSPLKKMGAGIVVGIDLNGVSDYPQPDSAIDVVVNAIDITMDLRTRDQIKDADVIISLDLSSYKRFDNTDRHHELFLEGYHATQHKLSRLTWYQRVNSLRYLLKLILEFIPLKVPHFIERAWSRLMYYKNTIVNKRFFD